MCMRLLPFFFLILFISLNVKPLSAQGEGSTFLTTGRGAATTTVTDYEAIGINPANLGRDLPFKVSVGLAEVGFSLYSEALLRSDLRDILFNFRGIDLTEVQEEVFSQDFVESGQAIDLDAKLIGMGLNLRNGGGLAFDIQANASGNLIFNDFGSSLIFQGFDFENYFDTLILLFGDTTGVASTPQKISSLFKGTRIGLTTTAEFNIAYGQELWSNYDYRLLGGIGARYIMGTGIFDFRVEDDELKGFSSLSPGFIFELDSLNSSLAQQGDGFKPVGHGFGFDLGLSLENDRTSFGLALTDLGLIRWTGNVVSWNDALIDSLAFSGINTINIFDELDLFIQEQLFETNGEEAKTSILPAKMRAGIGYRATEELDIGAEIIIPLNDAPDNLQAVFASAGAEYCFARLFNLSAGVAVGGNYDVRVPAGFTVKTRVWEGGIATRDLLTLFGERKPTISMAAGFLRFKFGQS